MKTKKILSGVLVVLMLFSVFSVVAFAADEGTTEKPLKYTFTLTSGPSKTEYYDYEKFDPNGIAVTVTDAALSEMPFSTVGLSASSAETDACSVSAISVTSTIVSS